MNKWSLIGYLLFLFLTSCIVQSPKFSTLDKVLAIRTGMNKEQVTDILGVKPYDLKSTNDTNDIYIYVYRVTDRKTIPLFTKPVNGKEVFGKYVDLFIAYSKEGKVVNIQSCSQCGDSIFTGRKIDFEKILAFITVTLPIILIYFGLKK